MAKAQTASIVKARKDIVSAGMGLISRNQHNTTTSTAICAAVAFNARAAVKGNAARVTSEPNTETPCAPQSQAKSRGTPAKILQHVFPRLSRARAGAVDGSADLTPASHLCQSTKSSRSTT